MAPKRMYNNINKPFILIKWKIEANQCILTGSTVLIYVNQKDFIESKTSHEQKLKSSIQGIVLNLLVNEGEVVQPGAPLLEFNCCSHEIVLKGICVSCGKDIWSFQHFYNFEGIGLHITEKQREHLEKSGESKLLRNRKLALLICVDHILADVKQNNTCEKKESLTQKISEAPIAEETYELYPDTQDFLKIISKKYDVNFFTHGNKCQGKEIARLLNKVCGIFPSYIWTNEDFRYRKSDKEKLEVVFHNGHSMACIIDCNENTWQYDHNIVWVKSYSTFYASENKTVDNTETIKNVDSEIHNFTSDSTNPELLTRLCDMEENLSSAYNLLKTRENVTEFNDTLLEQDNNMLSGSLLNINSFLRVIGNMNINIDSKNVGNYTSYLKSVLHSIHCKYYHLLDQMIHKHMYVIHQQVIPDLKYVIPYVWKTVLLGVNLNFSGFIPINVEVDIESCPYWILAKALGANVTKELVLDNIKSRTTHIIATKFGTNKVNLAEISKDIFIVTIDWLYHCAFGWCHIDEKHFLLGQNSEEQNAANVEETEKKLDDLDPQINDINHVNAYCDIYESSSLNTNLPSSLNVNLTSEELNDMVQEVDNEIDSSSTSSDDDFGDHITTVHKRKWYSVWNRFPHIQKRQKCVEFVDNQMWDDEAGNDSFSNWNNSSNDDMNNISETESVLVDYVYSEDDDPLLRSQTDSDYSDT